MAVCRDEPWASTTMKAINKAITENQGDTNPFILEGDTTFMRHDAMRVVQISPGLFAVEFLWRGALIYTMRVECDFAAGQQLALSGLEGRMKVELR